MKTVFSITNVSKKFGNNCVLKDISMQIKEGEVIAIIGPSGSGKTTFLRCCALLEKMDHGTLDFGGITAAKDNGSGTVYASAAQISAARKKFGFVFQNFNLFPHFSVLRNVSDALTAVYRICRAEAEKKALSLLARMGLAERAGAYPCELSGGQQQRVSIARALAPDPEILFFDEPTSALDPELTNEILRVIRQLAEEKMTMVIITHEISFAAQVADRVVFMADGVIVEEGTPAEVIGNPSTPRTRAFLSDRRI